MAGLQVFSRDLCPKKGRHISRADLFLSLFNFHGILISVSLPLLIPASVLPDKPAVRCHAVREHDSLCSIGNLIERTRRRRTSGGRSPTTTAAERRHSNHSSPAGLEHRKKSHPSDDSFFYLFESTRRDSNPRPSPWQGDTPPLSHSCIGNIPSKPHIELHQPLNLHLTFLDKPSTD